MVSLKISELRLEEIPLIKEELQSDQPFDFEEHFKKQLEKKVTVLIAWLQTKNNSIHSIPIGRMVLIWHGELDLKKVVGFVPNAEKYISIPAIMRFWIKPKYRSHGFGWQMLLFAQKITKERGFNALSLAVYEDNPKAYSLYKKFGFIDSEVPLFMLEPPYLLDSQKQYDQTKIMRYLVKSLD